MAVITLHPFIESIHGKIGSIVFVKRNKTQFIRSYVVPYDPKTELQIKNRNNFARLVKYWQMLPYKYKYSWNRYGDTLGRKGYNVFISENMKKLKSGEKEKLFKEDFLLFNKDTNPNNYMSSNELKTIRSKFFFILLLHFRELCAGYFLDLIGPAPPSMTSQVTLHHISANFG